MSTYDYYRIFYHVAQHHSFTKAAEVLHNNQPNITRCMNNLETELGCHLFVRSNRGVSLTPEGQKLFNHVAIAFEQLELGEAELKRDQSLTSGLISIGVSENALRIMLLSKLEAFHNHYPHVRLKISNHSTPQAIASLESGLVDFAIVTTPLSVQKQFQKTYKEMKQTLTTYQELTGGTPDLAPVNDGFPLSDPTAILEDLQNRMQQDFPALADLTAQTVQCDIQDVDAGLETYSSPAFYMLPPIDALMQNTIRINRSSTADGIELYTTLAHEGYPGHLYQTVYSSLVCDTQTLPIRKLFSYGGYVEGWAYYTERISYEYAAQVLAEAEGSLGSSYPAALLCTLLAQQRDLQINLFCLLDLSLHYYGTEESELLRSLESFGLSQEQSERVYDYLRTAPAVYLKYYVGYLEMNALKKRAELQWSDNFSLLRFHRFVLEAGPSDFENLTKRLKQTAAKTG